MRNITLELMRHGSDHNQLLSPGLPYLAVCENAPVTTVYLPYEHEELLIRLASLAYPDRKTKYTEAQRRFQLTDIGRTLGRLLADIPGLTSAVGVAKTDQSGKPESVFNAGNAVSADRPLVNLRLVLSAKELALVPFELAIAQAGLPGTAQHLLLQLVMPFCITREARRAARSFYCSPKNPKILFAYCDLPNNAVPSEAHALALREALSPWLRAGAKFSDTVTVLRNAALADITAACRLESYTHVHLLAHGVPLDKDESNNSFFAIALRKPQAAADEEPFERVSASNLARALSPLEQGQERVRQPTVVTLATCQSGATQQIPLSSKGESIAHALHEAGIAMVVASQFPLTFQGSVVMTQQLYKGLMRARDPRLALLDTRHEMARVVPSSHDWASLVCYLSLHPDFDQDNARTEIQRLNQALIMGDLERADIVQQADEPRFVAALAKIDAFNPSGLVRVADTVLLNTTRAGIHRRYGAWLYNPPNSAQTAAHRAQTVQQLRLARSQYLAAYEKLPGDYWTLTEALRLDLLIAALTSVVPAKARVKATSRLSQTSTGLALPAKQCWQMLASLSDYQLAAGLGTPSTERPTEHSYDRPWALVNAIEILLLGNVMGWADELADERATKLTQELVENYPINQHPRRALIAQLKRYDTDLYRLLESGGAPSALPEVLLGVLEMGGGV